jgi:hypothetical protein
MYRWIVVGAVALGLVTAGCVQPAPPPPDYATISAVQASATVTQNQPFIVDVFAEDLGSPQYDVTYTANGVPPDLQLQQQTCNGTQPNTPSADTPACEYDSATTTLNTVTKTEYQFVWTGSKGVRFSFQVCAASETNPPTPFPTGGSCVTKEFSVATT